MEAVPRGVAIEELIDDKAVIDLASQLRGQLADLQSRLRTEYARKDIHHDIADRDFRRVLERVAMRFLG